MVKTLATSIKNNCAASCKINCKRFTSLKLPNKLLMTLLAISSKPGHHSAYIRLLDAQKVMFVQYLSTMPASNNYVHLN